MLAEQVRVVRLDLRGAGKGLPLARRGYHAGCSDDLRAALAEVHRWSPASPLLLIGVSLGGAIALKLAGEAAGRPVPGLERVAAPQPKARRLVTIPFDCEIASRLPASEGTGANNPISPNCRHPKIP